MKITIDKIEEKPVCLFCGKKATHNYLKTTWLSRKETQLCQDCVRVFFFKDLEARK